MGNAKEASINSPSQQITTHNSMFMPRGRYSGQQDPKLQMLHFLLPAAPFPDRSPLSPSPSLTAIDDRLVTDILSQGDMAYIQTLGDYMDPVEQGRWNSLSPQTPLYHFPSPSPSPMQTSPLTHYPATHRPRPIQLVAMPPRSHFSPPSQFSPISPPYQQPMPTRPPQPTRFAPRSRLYLPTTSRPAQSERPTTSRPAQSERPTTSRPPRSQLPAPSSSFVSPAQLPAPSSRFVPRS